MTEPGPLPHELPEGARDQPLQCLSCGAAPWAILQPEDGQLSAEKLVLLTPEMDRELAKSRPPLYKMPPGQWTHVWHEALGLIPIVPACHVCGRSSPKDFRMPLGEYEYVFMEGSGVAPVVRTALPSYVQQAPVQTQQAGQASGASTSQAAPKPSQIPNVPPSTQAAPSGAGPKPSVPSKVKKRKQPRPAVPLFGQLASVPEFWQYWDKGGPLSLGLPVRDLVENLPPGRCRDWKHAAAYLVAFRQGMAPEEAAATEEQIRMAGRIHQTVHFYVKRMARENTEDVQAAAARAAGVVVDWSDSD